VPSHESLLANEKKALFKATISAGIAVSFQSDAPISCIPTLSKIAVSALKKKKLSKFKHFANRDFTKIIDLLDSFDSHKQLLIGLVLAKVSVRFHSPKWTEPDWKRFVQQAVGNKLLTWEEVATTICGELNPPQVGTGVARRVKATKEFEGKTMQNVYRWLYAADGLCKISQTRLFLEADHIKSIESFIKELEPDADEKAMAKALKLADELANFQLLSKRQNVIKRGSHKLGGLSFAPAAAVMPYLILRFTPKTYQEFYKMCRHHGLTMADIRIKEGWALAWWLHKAGLYEISEGKPPFIETATDAEISESS